MKTFSNVNKYFIMNKHQNVLKCKQTLDINTKTFSNLKMVFRKLVIKSLNLTRDLGLNPFNLVF